MRLIDADALVDCFENKGVQIIFDLPIEEVLGEDIDLDDFAMLVQDAVQVYKKMVLDTVKNQPTAYNVERVVQQLEDKCKELEEITLQCKLSSKRKAQNYGYTVAMSHALEIIHNGGKE